MIESYTAPKGNFPAYRAHANSLEELPAELVPSSARFVVLIAADTTSFDGPFLVNWARKVLDRGATYVCCWGPGAERLEACFDEADLERDGFDDTGRVIMTTSHESEPLRDAAWFALHVAFPDHGWAEGTGAVVLASVGRQEWANELRAYLEAGAPPTDAP